jgi:uncharacterized Zn finger protein
MALAPGDHLAALREGRGAMNEITIGKCSICGGEVTCPQVWHGIVPPTPRCRNCGAVPKATRGPVIPMEKPPETQVSYTGTEGTR